MLRLPGRARLIAFGPDLTIGAGHDVIAVAESARGITDREVLRIAKRERRILITEDRDFGQLVFADLAAAEGVLYICCPESARKALPEAIVTLVTRLGDRLKESFVVWLPRRVRIRSLRL